MSNESPVMTSLSLISPWVTLSVDVLLLAFAFKNSAFSANVSSVTILEYPACSNQSKKCRLLVCTHVKDGLIRLSVKHLQHVP